MSRRFLGVPESAWRLLLAGSVAAIWLLVFWNLPLWANDCAQYVSNPSNFTGNLQGLIEDCMRTGSVQAITTILVGGVGGGAIAVAVQKGLQDAVKAKGTGGDPGLVKPDDPGQGKADDPGTGKDGLPEAPPPTTGRDSVPETCRGLWDEYNTATREEFQKGKDVNTVNEWYIHVVQNHMNNLAKVTIQLGVDAADLASAGVGGIKGGAGIAKVVSNLGDNLAAIKTALTRAIAHSAGLETFIYNLAVEIGTLMQKGTRIAGQASDAARLSAKAESKIADLVTEAAHLEGQIGKYDELVRFARSVDSTLLERNAASKLLREAESALTTANQEHQKILNRKKTLNDWAAAERAAIENEDARAFNTKHEELGDARDKLAAQAAKDAEEAKVAHKEWQDKMGELSAAKKELEEARAAAAHLQKAKQEKILAEQEVRRAAGVRDEAATRLDHAEGELAGYDRATKELDTLKKEIPELEAQEKALVTRIDNVEKAKAARQAFLEAETAVDTASQAVNAAETEIRRIQARIDELTHGAEWKRLKAEEMDLFNQFHEAKAVATERGNDYMMSQDEFGRVDTEITAAVEAREGIPPVTPAEKARMAKARSDMNAAQEAYGNATQNRDYLENKHVEKGRDATKQHETDLAQLDQEGLKPDLESATQHKKTLDKPLEDALAEHDRASKALQPYDHPGIDVNSGPQLRQDLTTLQTEINNKKFEAASKVQEVPRSQFETKVSTAKADVGTAKKVHADAETRLATAEEDLKIADLSGTGEPLDNLRTLEARQARYSDLVREQEALRVKYEALKSGGNHPEAAALKSRIDVLEVEIAKWKSPDIDSEMARRNPSKHAEWKAEQGGADRIGVIQSEIDTLQTKINDLRTNLATVERKLSDEQQKAGGKSTAELEAERNKIKGELTTKQAEMTAVKDERTAQDKAKADAEQQKKENDATIEKKEAEKRKAEEDKRKSDEEIAKYKQMQDNPVARPDDASWLGGNVVGPMMGNKWTPYHGSDAEGIANASHALRKKLDENLDAITPDWLTWPFRKAGALAGEAFHKAFGGQSPEEVAAALKHGNKRVNEMKEKLRVVQEEFDALQKKAHDAKAALDRCVASNRPSAGNQP